MTDVLDRRELLGTPTPNPVDWARVQKWGALGGLTMSFIAAIGMVTALDRRLIISPWLSLGFLTLVWVPVVYGAIGATEDVADGSPPPVKGERDLIAGLVTGLLSGLFFAFFIVLIDAFDFTEIFRNLGPRLVELLTFGRGIGVAAMLWIIGSGLLGLVGGALKVVPRRVRSALGAAVVGVLGFALLEIIVTDITQGLHIEFVSDWIYALNGGLTALSAGVVALIAGTLGWRSDERTLAERRLERMSLEPKVLFRRNVIAGSVTVLAVIFLPMILGGLTNELLANVGLFVLMGLGLNIVVGSAGLLDLGYVAFFAVGAYTTAVLTSPLSPWWTPEFTLNFLSWEGWLIMAIVLVMAAIAGIVVGTPVIRLRGDYLAIVTLGFGEIIRILFLSDWLTRVRRCPGHYERPFCGAWPRGHQGNQFPSDVLCCFGVRGHRNLRGMETSEVADRASLDGASRGRGCCRGDGGQHDFGQAHGFCDRRNLRGIRRHDLRCQGRCNLSELVQAARVDHHPRRRDRRRHGFDPCGDHRGCCPDRSSGRTDPTRFVAGVRRVQAPHVWSVACCDDAQTPRGVVAIAASPA